MPLTARFFLGNDVVTPFPKKMPVPSFWTRALCTAIAGLGLISSAHGAGAVSTATSLALTASGTAVSSVASGTAVTLTATVSTGGSIAPGLVKFCDAASTYCLDSHLLGSAQVTSTGTATLRLRPALGSHSYKAVFAGTTAAATSSSATVALIVTGTNSTIALASSGNAGNYSLTATVTGTGASVSPSGAISFTDLSNASGLLGTTSLRSPSSVFGFQTSQLTVGSNSSPAYLTSADFNSDGIPDLFVASSPGAIYLGAGDGTFTLVSTSPAVTGHAVAGDFNEDGSPDLAIFNSGKVTTLFGNGDGTFSSGPSTSTTSQGLTLAVGDFNGDGHADLVQLNSGNTATILLGDGTGRFAISTTVTLPTNFYPAAPVIAADLNEDGFTDLAFDSSVYAGVVTYISRGDGTFSSANAELSSVGAGEEMAAADFNGDGHIDLVETHGGIILLGNGAGEFTNSSALSTFYTSSFPYGTSVVTADFNGDGIVDSGIVFSNGSTQRLSLFLGKGDGSFTASSNTALSTNAIGLIAADLNNDGRSDLVFTEVSTGHAAIYLMQQYATATATLTAVSPAGTGNHQVQAAFGGDANYGASTSSSVTLTAQPIATALTIMGSPSISNVGQQVLLTSTLSPATAQAHSTDGQTVTFLNGTTTLGTGTLASGLATLNLTTLPAGTNSLSANYAGDTNFAAAKSSTLSYSVTVATTLSLAANPGSSSYGQSVTLTATLNPANSPSFNTDGDSVTFYSGSTALGIAKLTGGIATFSTSTLSAGQLSLTAKYGGDSGFAAATSNATAFTVLKATPVITWSPASGSAYTGTSVGTTLLNAALANSNAGIAGSFSYQQTVVGAGTTTLLPSSVLSVGSYTLTTVFTPTNLSNYTTASVTVPYVVTPATLTVVASDVSRAYSVATPALTGTVKGALGNDAFTVSGSTTATTTSSVGTYPISYIVTGTNLANYQLTPATGTLTVTQATPTIIWPNPSAITYGTALGAAQLNATSTIAGTFTYGTASGTVLGSGSQTLTATFTPTDRTNYSTQTASAALTVTKASLAISATNAARVFGAANPTFTGSVTGLVNGDTVTQTFATTATASSIVGSYPIVPAVSGANVPNYNVAPTNGALTVSQAGTATTLTLSNANTTFTANVTPLMTGSPSGTVTFYEGQTVVGTSSLSNGVATYSGVTLPSGNVTLSAQYSGDANFTQSASPAALILAVTPASSSLTVATSGNVKNSLALTTPSGYSGTVQFSCTGLPAAASCSFSPSSVVFTGTGAAANVVLTVSTGVTTASAVRPAFMHAGLISAATLLAIPGFLLAGLSRRRDWMRSAACGGSLLLLLLSLSVGASGCASGPSSPATTTPPATTTTPAGTTTFQVLATGSAGLTLSTPITLNVQ